MKTYTVKEASDIAGIPTRTITYNCKRDNVRKVSNRYQITQSILDGWIEKINSSSQHYRNLAKVNEERAILISEMVKADTKRKYVLEELKAEYKETEKALIKELEGKNELLQSYLKQNEELKNKLKEEVPHQKKLINAIELITLEAMKKGVQHKIFTDEEYNDLIGTISEVDFQKEQVQYLRTRVEKQDEILNRLVKQAEQRNYIEAREKGFDKK